MKLPENFCVAPFLQLTTHPSGSCSPCPYLGGTTWPPSNKTIRQQWTDPKLEQLRQDFINNKKSEICTRCWHEEENGKKSLRLRLFDPVKLRSEYTIFKDTNVVMERLENLSIPSGPMILTIKNGNVCNAKCRTCHPIDSSRWVSDAKKVYESTKYQYYNFAALDNKPETNWSDEQIQEIIELCTTLRRLELFGGESAYNKQVKSLLEQLVDLGISRNLTLYLNTNGSVDITEEWPFLNKFKNVEVMVSVDGTDEQFNYIRHGVEYTDMIANVRAMQKYALQNKFDLSVRTICTVNTLNVFYLPEIKQAMKKLVPVPPFLNLLVDPPHLFIKNIPEEVKQQIIAKLGRDPYYAEIVNVLNQPADLAEWENFKAITKKLDVVRKENFAVDFPEISSIMNF